MEDKYIGLALAISSSLAIGTSFVITKKGLMKGTNEQGEGYGYLKNATWWCGTLTMVVGEVANFAAYTFAPPILVTPLGALSVIIGAVLASFFLKEQLGTLGKMGCAICLLGSVIIVLHAPADREVNTIDEILTYAAKPAFLFYMLLVATYTFFMVWKIVPKYGNKNPMIYISICSVVGSISVCAIKAFGIALRLTLEGNNQFTHPSTYLFIVTVVVCIITQMNYFNKALAQFDTSIVNPLYYVTFTTATLCASFILFRGFNTTSQANIISLICGFLIIFSGVYLLDISRHNQTNDNLFSHTNKDGLSDIPLEAGIGAYQFRRSIQLNRPLVNDSHYHDLSQQDVERNGRRRADSFEIDD
ncbi:unnamed protein product [[Candida] boidinii]|uniref:Unnamed protein product n=1 Tax=Candida boidinii TaxID=5477 RepID=A0A9W6WJK7_CANBO|nr:hypothetical protein B5S30_g3256 [[Candida] boidinii]GME74268.1 unnamed protein product [[Candida] boidinii]GMG08852.1 unnamed protein product [[Candida] boidinii]